MNHLKLALRALFPLVYVKTHNDRGVAKFCEETISAHRCNVRLFHPLLGAHHNFESLEKQVNSLLRAKEPPNLSDFLGRMVEYNPKDVLEFYVFFEADDLIWDAEFQQALRLLYMQREASGSRLLKQVILIGSKGEVPERLKPYVYFADEMKMTPEAIITAVSEINANLPGHVFHPEWFVGVESPVEISTQAHYAIIRLKDDTKAGKPPLSLHEYIQEFKRETRGA